MPFVYKNVQFQKHEKENWVVVRGEIYNNSSVNYHSVAFRMVIFIKGTPPINTVITINGFSAGKKQTFEKQIEVLDHRLINNISRYEITPAGAY
jgi:proteasome assembly chaperone (PAC2) family protein